MNGIPLDKQSLINLKEQLATISSQLIQSAAQLNDLDQQIKRIVAHYDKENIDSDSDNSDQS